MNLYLTDKQVSRRYSISRSTLWRWVKEGMFPKPVKLSDRCTRWKLENLEKWERDCEKGE